MGVAREGLMTPDSGVSARTEMNDMGVIRKFRFISIVNFEFEAFQKHKETAVRIDRWC